ncbi:hypothetical protein MPH_14098 [Macrophomina phaseolina MS6]|uniref:Uncharacterized protein n=1 Tax=Macrophomina phaseolina (strain MS6) TaxID=1126212 RepID=K2RFU1_MACPH|nr:hypothetical protein MPH_14098 [Macrophomina phaseolina MS6]
MFNMFRRFQSTRFQPGFSMNGSTTLSILLAAKHALDSSTNTEKKSCTRPLTKLLDSLAHSFKNSVQAIISNQQDKTNWFYQSPQSRLISTSSTSGWDMPTSEHAELWQSNLAINSLENKSTAKPAHYQNLSEELVTSLNPRD